MVRTLQERPAAIASVSLHRLGKTSPGGVDALRGIDLDIAEGEFLCIVGASGCGKSTLLRIVAGFEPATAG